MKKSETINLNDLPSDVIVKIPYSIRTSKDVHVISELPHEIQYIIQEYLFTVSRSPNYADIYDAQPEVSVYGDFDVFRSKRDLVKHYLHNYLLILLGSYPFDTNFGCRLKEQLQTKDESMRQTLISNEINLIVGVIKNDTDAEIQIKRLEIVPYRALDRTEYSCLIEVEVEDEYVTVTV